MERYAVSSGTISSLSGLLERIEEGQSEVVTLEQNMPDRMVATLTGTGITSLLVLIGLIALFIEITSPGFGIPGTVAIVAFTILFISHSFLGTVGSVELLIFVLGIVLLLLEIFIIPGFGVAGVSGILLIVVSLILAMQDFVWPAFEWQWDILRRNFILVLATLAGAFVSVIVIARMVPGIALFRGLMLSNRQLPAEGYSAHRPEPQEDLVGMRGTAVTTLRPVGKAEIGDQVRIVEAEGEYIGAGSAVVVTEVSGNRITVREA
jgi:membrane-bound serine protease (ClpP class)